MDNCVAFVSLQNPQAIRYAHDFARHRITRHENWDSDPIFHGALHCVIKPFAVADQTICVSTLAEDSKLMPEGEVFQGVSRRLFVEASTVPRGMG
jgi:hypothetical protein